MTKPKSNYDSDDIRTLQFPENIREKPTMYIGPIDESGIFTIVREVADNVVDEALAERATSCDIFIKSVGQDSGKKQLRGVYVLDDGEGIPVKDMTIENPFDGKKLKVPAIKAILTMTHTSGKFHDKAYAAARGSHGIGVKASNALSRAYRVWTFRDGSWWHIAFEYGKTVVDLAKKKEAPTHPSSGKPLKRGTLVYLEPDPKIFSVMTETPLSKILSPSAPTMMNLLEWCRIASYFTPKFRLTVHHEAVPAPKEFFSENGPRDFITRRIAQLNKQRSAEDESGKQEKIAPISDNADFVFQNTLFECIMTFTNSELGTTDAFTNGLRNAEGGVHLNAMIQALYSAVQPYTPKGKTFTQRELREGLVSLINVRLSSPQFNSQTKEKLVDERGGKPVYEFLLEGLSKFFKANKDLAVKLTERASNLHALKTKFLASKKVISSLRAISRKGLPVKGTVAPDCKPHERELFLIEGDSAAGTARLARFPDFQETLPLKGKVKNALRDKDNSAVESEEIINILAQIGFDPKAEDPYSKLRVGGKIVMLADPDPDGPLFGSTEVPVKWMGDWHIVTMEALAEAPWTERSYQVVSWNGHATCLATAQDARITSHVSELIQLTLDDGSIVKCNSSHKFPILGSSLLRDAPLDSTGLMMVSASLLKTGDRIQSVGLNGKRFAPQNCTGRPSLDFAFIRKIQRIKCEQLVPVYCLTVPVHHNFMLSCGIFSANCHINSLLLSLIYKFLPDLFTRGMIYVAKTPEFYAVDKNGKPYFGSKAANVAAQVEKAGMKAEVMHIKGYGEVSDKILRILAFDPATRNIVRIMPCETSQGEAEFISIMSGTSEARKEMLGI